MGLKELFTRKQSNEEEIDPRSEMPIEIVELVQRKRNILKDTMPKPGTPEAVIAERFDRQIESAWKKHNGETQ